MPFRIHPHPKPLSRPREEGLSSEGTQSVRRAFRRRAAERDSIRIGLDIAFGPQQLLSRDAAILRFELTFEVGWKLIQVLAREEGYEVKSPRQAFQQAFSLEWVTDEVVWIDILKARNMAAHV